MSIEQFRKRIKQELLSKHAKFFAADKKVENPIFQGIRYFANGTAVVTNTHTLLRIKDVSPFPSPCTLHAITGAELDGVYPSIDATDVLFCRDPENQIILENPKQLDLITKHAKIAVMLAKELKCVNNPVNLVLSFKNAHLEINDSSLEWSALVGYPEKDQEETWCFNANYLYNALNLFRSAKTRSLTIKLRNKFEPIILSDEENGIDVIILPICSAS